MTDYIGIIINAMFTGIGVALGNWIWNMYLENKVKKLHENAEKVNNLWKPK